MLNHSNTNPEDKWFEMGSKKIESSESAKVVGQEMCPLPPRRELCFALRPDLFVFPANWERPSLPFRSIEGGEMQKN